MSETASAAAEKQITSITAPTSNPGRELLLYGMDREQMDLLKRTIAKGVTDDQLSLFLMTAKRRRLDPFARQIWAVLRYDKDSRTHVMSIQTGIDGFRVVAQRTGQYAGQDAPQWCGIDGAWTDVWLSDEPPLAARVLVYRKDIERPFVGIAKLKSYAMYKDDGKTLSSKWGQMPEHMLAKCAEALGMRKAFPEDLSGLYTPEEMDHVESIDVPYVEKLQPTAATEPQVDTWAEFLADLTEIGEPLVEKCGLPVAQWTEEEVSAAWRRAIAHDTVQAINKEIGPWALVIDRHAKVATRVARLKDVLAPEYKARTAAIREADKARQAAAPEGGQA